MFYRDTKLRLTLFRQAGTTPKSENILNVFDRKTKQTQRNRTALLENYSVYDYLKEEVSRVALSVAGLAASVAATKLLSKFHVKVSRKILPRKFATF